MAKITIKQTPSQDFEVFLLMEDNKKAFTRTDTLFKNYKKNKNIEIFTYEATKWNWPSSSGDVEKSKEDGSFDIEGHGSCDVYAIWYVNFWNPANWKDIIPALKGYFNNINSIVFENFSYYLKKDKKYLWDLIKKWVMVNPFESRQDGWIWVVDSLKLSMEEAANELAEDILAQKMGHKDSLDLYEKTKNFVDFDESKKIAQDFLKNKHNQVFSFMMEKGGLIQITNCLYVKESDPTCMVFDEKFLPFDLKDGWSFESIAAIISYWMLIFYKQTVNVQIVEPRD